MSFWLNVFQALAWPIYINKQNNEAHPAAPAVAEIDRNFFVIPV